MTPSGLPGQDPADGSLPAKPLPKDKPLRDLIDEFVESRSAANTRLAYRKALDDFLARTGIATLTAFLAVPTAQIVRYRNSLQKDQRSPATINQRLVALRGLFGRLLKKGRVARNPADAELVGGLRTSEVSKTEGLALDEIERMVASCDGTLGGLRDKALLLTLYYQGLRRSEASDLNYRDLVSRRGLLEIRRAKKSHYDTVRLRPEVKAAIEAYLGVLNRELGRRETRSEDPVFVSLSRIRSYGRRLSAGSVNVIVKARARAADIDRRISAHGLRHTCAAHGLARDVPLHQVQRHLRHKDIRTTLRCDRERAVRKNPMTDTLPALGVP